MNPIVSSPSPTNHPHLSPIRGERQVMIISGWAGAGKTTAMERLIEGLGSERARTSVIVNEIGGASTRVDLERLSSDLAKRGIQGCACCASNAQVLAALDSFHDSGKALTIIEQSGLSRTGELSHTVSSHGFRPFVVTVVNPHQKAGVLRYLVPHIRAADAIIITHCDGGGSNAALLNSTRDLIHEVTADRTSPPLIHLAPHHTAPFPEVIWQHAQNPQESTPQPRGLAARASGILGKLRGSNRSPGEIAEERARQQEVQNFTEIEVVLYPGATEREIKAALASIATASGEPIEILRAKGVLDGSDIDAVSDQRGYSISSRPRRTPSTAFGGADYLVIRSLDPRLRGCWGSLAATIGTPDFGVQAAEAVAQLYPTAEQLKLQLIEEGTLPVVFGADSLLWELSESLGHISTITDGKRKEQLALSIATALHQFLKVRLDLVEVLESAPAKRSPDYPQWLFDLWFVSARVLIHPQLSRMIASQEALRIPTEVLWNQRPILKMMQGMREMRTLTVNGRPELTAADVEWLKALIREGVTRREFSPGGARELLAAVQTRASKQGAASWSAGLDGVRASL